MSNLWKKYRFLVSRRIVQVSLLVLYFSANAYGLKVLTGTLSSSTLFQSIPLSDPFAVLQMLSAGAVLSMDVILGAIIILAFYMSIGGRAFCSWVCPINIITDMANWLRRVLYLDKTEKKYGLVEM